MNVTNLSTNQMQLNCNICCTRAAYANFMVSTIFANFTFGSATYSDDVHPATMKMCTSTWMSVWQSRPDTKYFMKQLQKSQKTLEHELLMNSSNHIVLSYTGFIGGGRRLCKCTRHLPHMYIGMN